MSREEGRHTQGAYERGPAARCGDVRDGMLGCLACWCRWRMRARAHTHEGREAIQKYPVEQQRCTALYSKQKEST